MKLIKSIFLCFAFLVAPLASAQWEQAQCYRPVHSPAPLLWFNRNAPAFMIHAGKQIPGFPVENQWYAARLSDLGVPSNATHITVSGIQIVGMGAAENYCNFELHVLNSHGQSQMRAQSVASLFNESSRSTFSFSAHVHDGIFWWRWTGRGYQSSRPWADGGCDIGILANIQEWCEVRP